MPVRGAFWRISDTKTSVLLPNSSGSVRVVALLEELNPALRVDSSLD